MARRLDAFESRHVVHMSTQSYQDRVAIHGVPTDDSLSYCMSIRGEGARHSGPGQAKKREIDETFALWLASGKKR